MRDTSREPTLDKKFTGGVLALIAVATSFTFAITEGNETFLPPQDKQSKIEVIAGETYGWISIINSKSGKRNALNLKHISSFWKESKKKTSIKMSMGGIIIVNTPYSEVWKKIAQASRK